MNFVHRLSFIFFFLLFANVNSAVYGQQGDTKEKQKDLLSSLNWKKWSPDPVPLFTPQESLSQFKLAPGFRIELVAHEPMVKDKLGNWKVVDWQEALEKTVHIIQRGKSLGKYGVRGLSSPLCSTEELLLFQKLIKHCGSDSVDF
ncbi:MAG: hypothetical protein CBC04_04425, partial [Verrucomicrobia bacterium TMED44]